LFWIGVELDIAENEDGSLHKESERFILNRTIQMTQVQKCMEMKSMFSLSWPDVNHCRTRLRRGGKGMPLLYLHGANGVPHVPEFLNELLVDWDVLVPEHPGFGESDDPDWLENMDDLAYFYLDWLDQLGFERVHVVGSSLGGWLTMELAIRQPQRFASLTLIGSAGLVPPPPGVQHNMFRWTPAELVSNTFHDDSFVQAAMVAPPDTEIAAKNRHTITRLGWQPRLHHPMLRKRLHRLTMPVFVAWGAQDKVLPVTQLPEFQRLIPHAEVRTYAACGHLPQVEQKDAFTQDLLQFLRSV
jgi:pimeloyl-ACP methyl ester carboxylesterase